MTAQREESEKRMEALTSLKTTLTEAKSLSSPEDLIQIKQVSQLKLQEVSLISQIRHIIKNVKHQTNECCKTAMYCIGPDLRNRAFWLLFVICKLLRLKRPVMTPEL